MISVVGKSDNGKTTLIEKLLVELKHRRYRVATIKHDVHGFDLDKPGKDTWRHRQAGADMVIISSPSGYAAIANTEVEVPLDQLAVLAEARVDLIITEGYKRGDQPKLEVSRSQLGEGLLCGPEDKLFAVATDRPDLLRDTAKVPVFNWNDAGGLIDLIEDMFLKNRLGETR